MSPTSFAALAQHVYVWTLRRVYMKGAMEGGCALLCCLLPHSSECRTKVGWYSLQQHGSFIRSSRSDEVVIIVLSGALAAHRGPHPNVTAPPRRLLRHAHQRIEQHDALRPSRPPSESRDWEGAQRTCGGEGAVVGTCMLGLGRGRAYSSPRQVASRAQARRLARPSGARTHLMREAIRGHQRQSEPVHLELGRTCVQSHQAQ